jgi:hypothetical protein
MSLDQSLSDIARLSARKWKYCNNAGHSAIARVLDDGAKAGSLAKLLLSVTRRGPLSKE